MIVGYPGPDFEAMAKSWRRASASQKVARVGIIGGAIGGLVYLFATMPRREAAAQPSGMSPAEQAARQSTPSQSSRTDQVRGWGTYR